MFQLSQELTAPSFYLWEPPRRFLKEPYISAHNSAQVKFLQVFLKSDFLRGELFFLKKILNVLSFLGLLYVLGYFKQKNFVSNNFLTNLPNLFVISAGQLSTRAAVKELGFRAEAGAVGSPRAESELQLRLSF